MFALYVSFLVGAWVGRQIHEVVHWLAAISLGCRDIEVYRDVWGLTAIEFEAASELRVRAVKLAPQTLGLASIGIAQWSIQSLSVAIVAATAGFYLTLIFTGGLEDYHLHPQYDTKET